MIRLWISSFLATATFATLAAPLAAQAPMPGDAPPSIDHHPVACPGPVAASGTLAGWAAPHGTLKAPNTPTRAATRPIALAHAYDTTLAHTPDVTYALAPLKAGGSVSYGGVFAFDAPDAATYRVALSSHSWVDVIEEGATVASSAHGHGPDCTGIGKMVDYPLKAGRHVLQISANGEPKMTLMVVRVP